MDDVEEALGLFRLHDAPDARVSTASAAQSRYRCVATLSGHLQLRGNERVNCVAALPDGRVVSGSDDRTLKVWDVSSERCLHTLSGHTSRARCRRPVEQRVDRSSTPRGRRSGAS